jgi:hypothetical protein
LARLSFPTTGFSDQEESRQPEKSSTAAVEESASVEIAAELFPELSGEVVESAPLPEPMDQIAEPEIEPVVEEPIEQLVEQSVALQVEQTRPLPDLVTKPLPLSLHVTAPGKGKPAQVFSSAPNAVGPQVPRSTSLPLRPVMIFGPAPAAAKAEVKIEPKKPVAAPVRPDPRVASGKFRGLNLEVPEEKAKAPEPVKEIPAALKQVAKSAPKVEGGQDNKPVPKSREEAKPPTVLPAPLAAPFPGTSDLGLPRLNLQQSSGFLGQMPIIAKIAIVVVLLAGLGGLIAFSSKTGSAGMNRGAGTIVAGSALPAGEEGWITDWGADPGVRRSRQISILRASQTLTDYRIEMQGQIESKAIGWVFRAADPKNFYVTKLEIVKPGLEPTVALVRFAIINGEEQAHAQLPLQMTARLDTMYKIRFDAVGDHFTTYVQDEKVDDWTDDHIKTGGVGFYRERGEDATLKGGMSVIPLMIRK